MPAQKIDITGRTFGRLTALTRVEPHVTPSGQRKSRWLCICECGAEVVVQQACLTKGDTRSCGCLRRRNDKEEAA